MVHRLKNETQLALTWVTGEYADYKREIKTLDGLLRPREAPK